MAAVTRDAGGKPAETTEPTLTEKVMLVVGIIAWAIVGVLVIGAVVLG